MGEGFAAGFGEVWVERAGFGDSEWTDYEGSAAVIEGYSMAESDSRVEGGSKRAIEVGNDGEVNGSGM